MELTLPVDAREYSETDWLTYGEIPTPNTRAKLIALTIEEMVSAGPSKFNVKNVCDRIDAKYALVNYYFGNKEMLIAEASATSYRKSIRDWHSAILSGSKDPETRLREHLHREMDWFKGMGPWALLVSYPIASDESRALIEDNFGDELKKYFEYYLCIVGTMILDLRKGTLSDLNFDITNYPKTLLLKHPMVVMDGLSMVWSAHGLNVWSAGQQIGSANLSHEKFTQKLAIEHHINRMVELAKER